MKHIASFIYTVAAGSILCLGVTGLKAQTHDNAYRFSTESLDGTARYQAMAGAMGAVGADYSSIQQNAAGLALFRSNELQATLSVGDISELARWYKNSSDKSRTYFTGNLSFVLASPRRSASETSFNMSIGFGQRQTFSREYNVSAGVEHKYSIADFAAFNTPIDVDPGKLTGKESPYGSVSAPWLSILGYRAGWTRKNNQGIFESNFYYPEKGGILGPKDSHLAVREKGEIQDFNITGSLNVNERIYLGANLKISSLDYHMTSNYVEDFLDGDYLTLNNVLHTTGTGVAVNLGMIARVTNHFRLGFSVQTPTWFSLKDSYYATASSRYAYDDDLKPLPEDERVLSSDTPQDAAWNYQLSSPTRYTVSAAIIGSVGILSLDYELTSFSGIKLSDRFGEFTNDNALMHDYFQPAQSTIRLGGEWRMYPQISLRLGGYWRQAPMKSNFDSNTDQSASIPVNEAGTVPHYEIAGMGYGITGGVGYRITPSFYIDLAAIYQGQVSHVYPFPTRFYNDGEQLYTPNPIRLDQSRTYGVVTLGYKF